MHTLDNSDIFSVLVISLLVFTFGMLDVRTAVSGQELTSHTMNSQDRKMLNLARSASRECAEALERAISTGVKNEDEIWSTLYFPILPLEYPPRFSTFYDDYTDQVIRPIEDRYLGQDTSIVFVVLVDRNGYLPSHNARYATGSVKEPRLYLEQNRTKRIFNDITGFRAAKNTGDFLLQVYRRDTGEIITDLSVPVHVNGKHWGALRISYKREK